MRSIPTPPTRALRALRALFVLAAVVFVLSYLVAWFLTKDAQLVQLSTPQDAAVASLFGETSSEATPTGKPQRYINITDPKAFLEGTGEGGARLVSEPYLKEKGIYPIQEKTVWFFHFFVALASGLGALLFGGLWLWLRGRTPRLRAQA